ncbi:MAG: hypothetical protein IKK78_03795 [Oscillospiraceae bacterium]|nr:hypothetical protein [Oscillospiraceae bacterium]
MNIQLPPPVKYAMNALNRAGYQAYIVGGCVRDMLLGQEPHDYDVTTSATPEEMLELFRRERLVTNGLKHGTVTLIKYGDAVEMTTFRIDGEYSDGRHPDAVEFTGNLYEDVARRDFTMNALCWNPETGLIDYVEGEEDIRKKCVRCVGDPDRRFNEDALRILRALRFSSVLDFDIDLLTAQCALDNRELLGKVSAERILVEVRKLLTGARAEQILMDFRPVFEVVMPELSELTEDEYMLAARRVSLTPPAPELRMAALLYGIAPEKISRCAARLKFSRVSRKFMETVGQNALRPLPVNRYEMRRMLGELGEEMLSGLIELRNADVKAMCHLVIQQGDCVSIKQLAVNGEDVFSAGVTRKKTGACLNALLDAVMAGRAANEKEALLELARSEFAEK